MEEQDRNEGQGGETAAAAARTVDTFIYGVPPEGLVLDPERARGRPSDGERRQLLGEIADVVKAFPVSASPVQFQAVVHEDGAIGLTSFYEFESKTTRLNLACYSDHSSESPEAASEHDGGASDEASEPSPLDDAIDDILEAAERHRAYLAGKVVLIVCDEETGALRASVRGGSAETVAVGEEV